jgi:hypothetical protein
MVGKVVADWRRCGDEAFVAALRPASGRLRRAKDLWARSPEQAKALVVQHFLARRHPRWAFDRRRRRGAELPSRNFFFGEVIRPEWYRRALRYEFYDYNVTGNFHKLTRSVDWDAARVRSYGSAGWLIMAFGYWGLFPAAGYAATRDPRYAKVFANCWRRWLADFPTQATDRGLAGGFAFDTRDRACLESFMSTGRRALVLIDVLYSGLPAALDIGTAFEVLKYLWFVAGLFARYFAGHSPAQWFHPGNHNLFDRGTVPFCLGLMFPEFEHAAGLRTNGRRLLRLHARDPQRGAIRPDGSSWEHSARYAWYAAGMFRQPLELARLNGVPLFAAAEEARVAQFLDHFADLTAPDGTLIPYGDCQPPEPGCVLDLARSVYSGTRCAWMAGRLGVTAPVHAPARRPRPAPRRGAPPATKHLPDSGIVVARTGWGADDSLLFVIGDPRAGYSGHSHHDFTSFQLWADGVPLFHDTATWAYRIDEIVPTERGYYYSAFSHNLLTVEGYLPPKTFRRMGDVNDWWGGDAGNPVVTRRCDLDGPRGEVVMSHRNYPRITVTRHYRFDLAARWVEFTDRVVAEDEPRRTFRQWLHPYFGARVRRRSGGSAISVTLDGIAATCTWTASRPLQVVVEPSPEVRRAARVFRKGKPTRAYAECRTAAKALQIACRIEWGKTPSRR